MTNNAEYYLRSTHPRYEWDAIYRAITVAFIVDRVSSLYLCIPLTLNQPLALCFMHTQRGLYTRSSEFVILHYLCIYWYHTIDNKTSITSRSY